MADPLASTHERIEAERKAALPEADRLREFRDYARGRQRSTLTAGQQRILRGLVGNVFCDNICRVILKAIRNRIRFARFEVSGEGAAADVLSLFLEDLEVKNNLHALGNQVHWATPRDGNCGVSLSWDGDRVVLARERYWNGKNGLYVHYEDDGTPAYAVKEWKEGNERRRTIWWPERIERYYMQGVGWKFLPRADGSVGGPLPWTRNNQPDGEPLGIPVVHFANHDVPNDGPGDEASDPDSRQGMSALDGGIVGLQDSINDKHRSIVAASRYAGYQMLYGTGTKPKVDPVTKRELPLRPEPGAMFTDESPDARFGAIAAGSIEQLVLALRQDLEAVSRISDVPPSEFTGTWPSGVALLTAQLALIEKVETLAASWGPAWGSVAHKATIIANTFGRVGIDEEMLITTVFEPISRHDPLTRAQIAEAEAPFVSLEETLRTLGKSPRQIQRIMEEREAEQKRKVAQERDIAEAAMSRFNQAQVPTEDGEEGDNAGN